MRIFYRKSAHDFMNEIIELINKDKENLLFNVVKWALDKNIKIATQPEKNINDYIHEVFSFVVGPSPNLRNLEWDQTKMILILSILPLFPNPSNIPLIPLQTNYGPLFSVIIAVHHFKGNYKEYIDDYIAACNEIIKKFKTGFDTKIYSAVTTCYYAQNLPTIIKNNAADRFIDIIQSFFESLNTRENLTNINSIAFISDMFRSISYYLLKFKSQQIVTDSPFLTNQLIAEFSSCFFKLITDYSKLPQVFLLNFLSPWYTFFITFQEMKNSPEFNAQIDYVASFCMMASSARFHELHKTFPWHIAFSLFSIALNPEQQIKILSLICASFHSVHRIEKLQKIPETSRQIHSIIMRYKVANDPIEFNYLITCVKSALTLAINGIEKIRVISPDIDPTADPIKGTKKITYVTFADQKFSYPIFPETDFELNSKIEEYVYPTEEAAIIAFEKLIAQFEYVRTKCMTAITFIFLFTESLFIELSSEDTNVASNAFWMLNDAIMMCIKMMILSSYKSLSLQRFITKMFIDKEMPGYASSYAYNKSEYRIPDFHMISSKYFKLIAKIPVIYFPIIAKNIAKMIYKAFQEGIMSENFITSFAVIQPDLNTVTIKLEDSIYSRIISELMQIAIDNLNLFFSYSYDETKFIYKWFLFVIRFGSPTFTSSSHPSLILFIRIYQKTFFNALVPNIRRLSTQAFGLKMIRIYQKILTTKDSDQSSQSQPPVKFKPIFFDDIHFFQQTDSFDCILNLISPEIDSASLASLSNIIKNANESNNPEWISKAMQIANSLTNRGKKFDSDNNNIMEIYRIMYKSIHKSKPEDQIIDSIPSYINSFVQIPLPQISIQAHFYHHETAFDLAAIIKEISSHFVTNEENIMDLFNFVVYCFYEVELQMEESQYQMKDPIHQLLELLCLCSNYHSIIDQVVSFSEHLVQFYGNLFVINKSNIFLLSLLSVSGCFRSENNKFIVDLTVSFFKYISNFQFPPDILIYTIEQMMSFFYPQHRIYSMVTAISLFTRFYPQFLSLDIIKSFLITSNEMCIFDVEFSSIMNQTIKNYLNGLNNVDKKKFIIMSYGALGTVIISCRLVLLHRMEKLRTPIPIKSISDFEGCDPNLVFQRLSAALVCGIDGPFTLTEQIKNIIIEFTTARNDNVNVLEKLSRKMTLYISILKNPDVFNELAPDTTFMSNFLNFICNTLSSRFPLMRRNAEKAFRLIVKNYSSDLFLSRQINEYCNNPSKIFSYFKPQLERIAFYRRLAKIIPNRMPVTIVQDFMNALFEYVDPPDTKKYIYLANAINFMKFISNTQLYNNPAIKNSVMEIHAESTYFIEFIDRIIILYQNPEIPFHTMINKYVIRFLSVFTKETVEYCLLPNPRSIYSFTFLKNLIIEDPKEVFFEAFIDQLENYPDIASYHPLIFEIMVAISEEKKYATNTTFLIKMERIFKELYQSYSEAHLSYIQTCRFHPVAIPISKAFINIMVHNPDIDRIVCFTKIFNITISVKSDIYIEFMKKIYDNGTQEFYKSVIVHIMTTQPKITPKMFEILLGNSIKYLDSFDDFDPVVLQKVWDFFKMKIFTQDSLIIPILVCLRRLVEKVTPTNDVLAKLYQAIQKSLSLWDVQTIVLALKFCCVLQERGLLIDKMFYQIADLLFTYNKFFDPPFAKTTFRFLKFKPERFDNIPSYLAETLAFLNHDKFTLIRESKMMFDIITELPFIAKRFPFSPIIALSFQMENRLLQAKINDESSEIDHLYLMGLKYCNIAQITKEESERFIKACFTFLGYSLHRENNTSVQKLIENQIKFTDEFFSFILKQDKVTFPQFLFDEIEQHVYSVITFGLICVATKILGEKFVDENNELIKIAFNYIAEPKHHVNLTLLEAFLTVVGNWQVSLEIATKLQKSGEEKMRERVFILWRASFHMSPNKKQALTNFWSQSDLTNPLSFKFMCSFIEELVPAEQSSYISAIMEKEIAKPCSKEMFGLLPNLIKSSRIPKNNKLQIIDGLIPLITKAGIDSIDNLISLILGFDDSSKFYCICLRILHAGTVKSNATRIHDLEEAAKLLPQEDPLEYLLTNSVSSTKIWHDKYLVFTISLFVQNTTNWKQLFTFANYLERLGSQMATSTFMHYLTDETRSVFTEFFKVLLSQKHKKKYANILSSLLELFQIKKFNINSNIAMKAIKHANNYQFFDYYLSDDTIPEPSLLMPHIMNDVIYGHFLPKLNINEATATALTFLNQYKASNPLYTNNQNLTKHPFFCAVNQINDHFLISENDQDFESTIRPLKMFDSDNDDIVEVLETAIDTVNLKDQSRFWKTITLAEDKVTLYIKSHSVLSTFARERACILLLIIQMLKKKSQRQNQSINIDFNKSINPILIISLVKIERLVFNIPTHTFPDTIPDENAIVLFPQSMKSCFPEIVGMTNRGLLAIGKSQIDSFFTTISQKINKKTISMNDWVLFAPFCFNVYLAQPSAQLFETTFGVYVQILNCLSETPQFVRHEAAARIITLIRFAIQSNDHYLISVVKSSGSIFKKNFAEVWKPWLIQIVSLSEQKWFCNMVNEIFVEMWYRTNIYSIRMQIIPVIEFITSLNKDQIARAMMDTLEKCMVASFLIDFHERDLQTVRTAVDEGIEFDLLDFRKSGKIPATPLEQAIHSLSLEELENICKYEMPAKSEQMKVKQVTLKINANLPYLLPIRCGPVNQISLFRIISFRQLAPEIVIFNATTSVGQNQYFLLQRPYTISAAFKPSILSICNISHMFKQIMKYCYTTRCRSVVLQSSHVFEICNKVLMIPLAGDVENLNDLYMKDVLIPHTKYAEKQFPIPKDSLLKHATKKLSKQEFYVMRPLFLRSIAAQSVVRQLFQTKYQNMNRFVFSLNHATLPLIHSDFELRGTGCAFRLSPNIATLLGPTFKGEFLIAMAATATAFMQQLEAVRACIEIYVGDLVELPKDLHIPKYIEEQRKEIEETLFEMSSPSGAAVSEEDSIEWYKSLDSLIDSAIDTENHPIDAFPWF